MLTLEIVTPEKRVYESTVTSVVLPTREGEIGVLAGHIPLIAILEAGEIEVVKEGVQDYIAVDKGYIRILGDRISVLTEAAIDIDHIDLDRVHEARQRAEKAIEDAKQNKEIDPLELDKLESQVRFAMAQELTRTKHKPTVIHR